MEVFRVQCNLRQEKHFHTREIKREKEEIREEKNRDRITEHKQTLALRSAVLLGVPGKEVSGNAWMLARGSQ